MKMPVAVPPIKCQGIKTKLVPLIQRLVPAGAARYVEPFLGSGVVAFNISCQTKLLCDANPHIIAFYKAIQAGKLDEFTTRRYLEREGARLSTEGADYFYEVRARFNAEQDPLDFLFLSRACFNGVMRFNRKGGFNVPFCKKPDRFSPAYITKICNQVRKTRHSILGSDITFKCQDFKATLRGTGDNDFIYCDPPYSGRHTDYFNSWGDEEEKELASCLRATNARFLISTWVENRYRVNHAVQEIWGDYHLITQTHFYHVGATEENRNSMTEGLILNYPLTGLYDAEAPNRQQLTLFEEAADYAAKTD